jgi:long-subunit acyl-CoA synthetase (AMP-forming)
MANFAIHRLGGIATLANAQYSSSELEYQLRTSGSKAVITCTPLLDTALKAAKAVGISEERVYIMDTALESKQVNFKTLNELIDEGSKIDDLEPLKWTKGQGGRQVAYLCYSSGTSGLPVC